VQEHEIRMPCVAGIGIINIDRPIGRWCRGMV
jgi:hypothetical protein